MSQVCFRNWRKKSCPLILLIFWFHLLSGVQYVHFLWNWLHSRNERVFVYVWLQRLIHRLQIIKRLLLLQSFQIRKWRLIMKRIMHVCMQNLICLKETLDFQLHILAPQIFQIQLWLGDWSGMWRWLRKSHLILWKSFRFPLRVTGMMPLLKSLTLKTQTVMKSWKKN